MRKSLRYADSAMAFEVGAYADEVFDIQEGKVFAIQTEADYEAEVFQSVAASVSAAAEHLGFFFEEHANLKVLDKLFAESRRNRDMDPYDAWEIHHDWEDAVHGVRYEIIETRDFMAQANAGLSDLIALRRDY